MEQIGGGNTDQLDFQIINKDEGNKTFSRFHLLFQIFLYLLFLLFQMKMI